MHQKLEEALDIAKMHALYLILFHNVVVRLNAGHLFKFESQIKVEQFFREMS